MKIENLDSLEKDELLRWFFHWLPMDRRAEMMRRYPQHYNKMVPKEGEPLLTVVQRAEKLTDGSKFVIDGVETDECAAHPVRKPDCER